MRAPNIPSFFKTSKPKSFNFKLRYYNERKDRLKRLKKGAKLNMTFNRKNNKEQQTRRSTSIILLIIILSLLSYKFIIN